MAISGLFMSLLASLSWGMADFAGGAATRRNHQYQVVMLASLAAVVPFSLIAFLVGEVPPGPRNILVALLAGLFDTTTLVAFYRGLARSSMSVVAPITYIIANIVPLAYSLALLGLPAPLQLVGFFLGLLSIWLVTLANPKYDGRIKLGVAMGFIAGMALGFSFLLVCQLMGDGNFGMLAISKGTCAFTTFMLVLRKGNPVVINTPRTWVAPMAGLFEVGGYSFYLIAADLIRMDAALILSSLAPVWTVILARCIFKEHVRAVQWFGIAVAIIAIQLISM